MVENTEIFRPIFSQKRQNLIDKLNFEITRDRISLSYVNGLKYQ